MRKFGIPWRNVRNGGAHQFTGHSLITSASARFASSLETSKIRASGEAERIQVGLLDDFIGRRQS